MNRKIAVAVQCSLRAYCVARRRVGRDKIELASDPGRISQNTSANNNNDNIKDLELDGRTAMMLIYHELQAQKGSRWAASIFTTPRAVWLRRSLHPQGLSPERGCALRLIRSQLHSSSFNAWPADKLSSTSYSKPHGDQKCKSCYVYVRLDYV